MKIATVFLVAVTVFTSLLLESSAAPKFVSDISKIVGDALKNTGDTAGNIVELIGKSTDGVLEKVADAGKGTLNKATKDIELVKEKTAKLVDGVERTLNDVTEKLIAVGGELGEKLKEALIKVKTILKKLIEVVKKILESIANGADDTTNELDGVIKDLVSKLKAEIAAVIEILEKVSKKGGNDVGLVNIVTDILAKIEKVVEGLLSKVAEAKKSTTTEIADGAKKIDNAALGKLAEKIIEAFEATITKLKNNLAEGTTDDNKKILDFLEWFLPYAKKIHENIREDVKVNDPKNREKLIIDLDEVLKATEAKAAKLIAEIKADEKKEVFKKTILDRIVHDGYTYFKKLEESMPTGNDANH